MRAFELLGILFAFVVIILIDMPKLKTTANKRKYMVVYYSIVAVSLVLGILEFFEILPDYYEVMVSFFQKMTGIQ
ncbi:hypothetical protein SDC9_103149 [bioreactor metagenome]|uniref:Uncharacterized protein n=1 Tax=bioreactor metagenome TaxID=1076179 RepID=A0A645ATF0_9ZZZZ